MTACILEEHCVPNKIILAHRPTLQELHFRERLLSDEETMSYNAAFCTAHCNTCVAPDVRAVLI